MYQDPVRLQTLGRSQTIITKAPQLLSKPITTGPHKTHLILLQLPIQQPPKLTTSQRTLNRVKHKQRWQSSQDWQITLRQACPSSSRLHALPRIASWKQQRPLSSRKPARTLRKQRQLQYTRCEQAFGQSRGNAITCRKQRKWPELWPSTGNVGRIAHCLAARPLCHILIIFGGVPFRLGRSPGSNDTNSFGRSQDSSAGIQIRLDCSSEGCSCEATSATVCFCCSG